MHRLTKEQIELLRDIVRSEIAGISVENYGHNNYRTLLLNQINEVLDGLSEGAIYPEHIQVKLDRYDKLVMMETDLKENERDELDTLKFELDSWVSAARKVACATQLDKDLAFFARETVKKMKMTMTMDELRKQYEKVCGGVWGLSWNKELECYEKRQTGLSWGGYVACARENNLLKY